jgi:hypothetical protein
MAVPMPAIAILIVCKAVLVPDSIPDENESFTHHQQLEWLIQDRKMICRRNEVALYDSAVDMGADERPFTTLECQRSGIMLGAEWDIAHPKSQYRFWRVACPVPTVNTETGEILSWVLPDCGHRDTVICEGDTAI